MGAELVFKTFFEGYFRKTDFEIVPKPKDLRKLYAEDHGIEPDFKILNNKNGKQVFVEMKRQHAGRGNAHERACRYFTPGMIRYMVSICGVESIIPMWIVFSNGITKDKKRVREIKFWFNEHDENYLFWQNLSDTTPIKDHFDGSIKPHLL